MAKKASNKDNIPKKSMTKLIMPVKSQRTGSYLFKGKMILLEKLNETVAKHTK
jgi:hypothetical protein